MTTAAVLPATWPSQAAPPVPATYDGRSLLAVQDNHLRWHLAAVGPGLLCDVLAGDVGHYTLTWDYDTTLIDCWSCLQVLRRQEAA
jgi:hypothetical protein